MSDDRASGEDESPWLREMVDDDFLGLFSEEPAEVARCARQVMRRSDEDPSVLERLIETLRTSVETLNDDTQASNWIALMLGRIGDPAGLPVLFLGLGGEDESLQEASRDAILIMGPPAIEALMDRLDEDPGPELSDAAYRLLGSVGSLEDRGLLERTVEFLADRVAREVAKPPEERRIESLFHASALLGDRRMIEPMSRVLREKFGGKNAAIQDSLEMLQENAAGEPLVFDRPWIEENRWLFEEDLDSLRVDRSGGRDADAEEVPEAPPAGEDPEEKRLSNYYWGLGTTLAGEGRRPLDARRFIGKPGDAAEEEESDVVEEGKTDDDDETDDDEEKS